MTGAEIITFFEDLVDDDSLDEDYELSLLNFCKDLIESDRPWRILIKEDSSNTLSSSDTYLTSKDLPDDFFSDVKLIVGSESDNSYEEYDPIAFEERRFYKNHQKYYIDLVNDKFYVCGEVDTPKTIYLYHTYLTDDIATDTSPVWPAKFHKLIAFLMAGIHKAGVDADVINVGQALVHNKSGMLLWSAMVNWDAKLKLRSMNQSTPMRSTRQPYKTNVIHELR